MYEKKLDIIVQQSFNKCWNYSLKEYYMYRLTVRNLTYLLLQEIQGWSYVRHEILKIYQIKTRYNDSLKGRKIIGTP